MICNSWEHQTTAYEFWRYQDICINFTQPRVLYSVIVRGFDSMDVIVMVHPDISCLGCLRIVLFNVCRQTFVTNLYIDVVQNLNLYIVIIFKHIQEEILEIWILSESVFSFAFFFWNLRLSNLNKWIWF